jgi:hypothetical protein
MISWPLYYTMLVGHFVLFFVAPIVLFRFRCPIIGGVIMLASTMMPIAGQALFTDSDSAGLAFLLLFEFPVACIVFVAGLIIGLRRIWSAPRRSFRRTD